MDMIQAWLREIQPYIPDIIAEHWKTWLGSAAGAIASIVAAYCLALHAWWRKQFHNTVHVGINTFLQNARGMKLILDVVFEDMLQDVINDPIARRLIHKAIKRTTFQQPFLDFREKDRWHVLNLMRLAIAETNKAATLAKLIPGVTIRTEECVFAMTYERYPNMRTGKNRVLLMQRSKLEDPAFFTGIFTFEEPHHIARIETLRKMQQDWLGPKRYTMSVRLNHAT